MAILAVRRADFLVMLSVSTGMATRSTIPEAMTSYAGETVVSSPGKSKST